MIPQLSAHFKTRCPIVLLGGFRGHKDKESTCRWLVTAGLYDAARRLQHVGMCAAKRKELVEFLPPYREYELRNPPGKTGIETMRRPAAVCRAVSRDGERAKT